MSKSKTIVPVNRSQMHKRVLDLATKLYPGFTIQNEVPVQAGSQRSLPVDIVIRDLKVGIECHGIQHFEFNAHFHKSPEDFTAQKNRDHLKARAIKAAGWSLVVIRYDEYEKLTKTKLAKKILAAITEKE